MKKLGLMLGAALVLSLAVTNLGKVSAATNDLSCEVYARSYSVGPDTITATFTVDKVGDLNCTKDVTVASWNAPNGTNGMPFSEQTFVDSKSGTFEPGFHSLTVKKPRCFYQIDLLRGLSPYGPSGGVDYTSGQFVSSSHGGQECLPPPPTPTPTPTPAPVQPATTVVQTGKSVSLPNTGPADILGISAATGAAAGIVHNIRRRIFKK